MFLVFKALTCLQLLIQILVFCCVGYGQVFVPQFNIPGTEDVKNDTETMCPLCKVPGSSKLIDSYLQISKFANNKTNPIRLMKIQIIIDLFHCYQ